MEFRYVLGPSDPTEVALAFECIDVCADCGAGRDQARISGPVIVVVNSAAPAGGSAYRQRFGTGTGTTDASGSPEAT